MDSWDEQPTPLYDDTEELQRRLADPELAAAEGDDTVIRVNDPALRDAVVEGYVVCPNCRSNTFIRNCGIGDTISCEDCGAAIVIAKGNIARANLDRRSERLARGGGADELRTIGPYRIERFLAAGGMADVYLSRHPELQIPVAIKVLNSQKLREHPALRDQFLQEARTAARIDHPNICRVYDSGIDGETVYIVMEYVPGGNVLQLARKTGGVLAPGQALHIATGVTEALCEAARHGIVHRDIKPENILIAADGSVKLADLGIAKATDLDDSNRSSSTFTKSVLGTPAYISPEQSQSAESVDARADIYSLGATLYHLTTGVLPFPANSGFQMMYKHVHSSLTDPRDHMPDLPEPVALLIIRMMAKNPDDRFPHARALLNELQSIRHQGVVTDGPAGGLPMSWRVAIVLAVLCLVMILLMALRR